MLTEVLSLIESHSHAKILDGTLGLGGYSHAMLERFPSAKILGIDRDPEAVKISCERLKFYGERFSAMCKNFGNISEIDGLKNFDVLVFDLGVSNMQITVPERGFSFNADGPLDMRMNPNASTPTAAEILRDSDSKTLAEIFRVYGEERYAGLIASAVKRSRNPISTTSELVDLIRNTLPQPVQRKMGTHPARRIFQALRIYVNHETEELESLLRAIHDNCESVLVIFVSYHSLEDRLIKHSFRNWYNEGKGRILTRHPITPSQEEIERNYKARSAKLRAILLNVD